MKWSITFLILMTNILLVQKASAQEGENQKISIKNFKLLENQSNFFTGKKGLKCEFDVYFSEAISDFMSQSYSITWRLEDEKGEVLFDSKKSSSFHDKSTSARAEKPFGKSDATYGIDDGVDLFINYEELDMPEGKNSCKLILTANHKLKNFPDFWSKEISFQLQKSVIQPFEKQVFKLSNLTLETAKSGTQKLDIRYDVNLAYGVDEAEDESYPIYWQLLDKDRKEVYNSSQDFFTKNGRLYLKDFKEDSKGGFSDNVSLSVDLKYLSLSGEQDLIFVLYIVRNEKKIRIQDIKGTVYLPKMYSFEEQKFTINHLKAKSVTIAGVSGLQVSFNCKFKYSRVSSESPHASFYFYAKVNSNGASVYNASDRPPYHTQPEYAAIPYSNVARKSADYYHSASLFIPYFLLNAKEGVNDIDLSLYVTNNEEGKVLGALDKITLSITKPRTITVDFNLTDLTLVKRSYDASIGGNYIKQRPDTQWFIKAGEFYLYSGSINYNSYEAYKDKVTLTFSEKDELWLVVVDHDNGLNPDDVLKRIKIPTDSTFVEVLDYKEGDIQKLSYTLSVKQ